MFQKRCSRCGMKGHERAACWYLTQMNLEARRLPDPLDKGRYARIRKTCGALGRRSLSELGKAFDLGAKKRVKKVSDEKIKEALPFAGRHVAGYTSKELFEALANG